MSGNCITVIGAGLSGCAAALTVARRGMHVRLHEQRPSRSTPVHESGLPCELSGSGDLGMEDPDRATGLLKLEVREICPGLLEAADRSRIGERTLMVDRTAFAQEILADLEALDCVEIVRGEVEALPEEIVIVATGPTTWSPLAGALYRACGTDFGFAYVGRPPLIEAGGIDLTTGGWWPIYPGAEPALFVPVKDDRLQAFSRRIADGERKQVPEFSDEMLLADEAVPAERLAGDPQELAGSLLRGPHGPDVPEQGPMLRLDPDNAQREIFHVHGFTTALTESAQTDALRALDGFERASIVRPGLIQRTPWVPGPRALLESMQLKRASRVFLTGTLAGAWGYMEAMATGVAAGLGAARLAHGGEPLPPPAECLVGALCRALAKRTPDDHGRMIQANYGMLPDLSGGDDLSKEQRRARQVEIAVEAARAWAAD